MEARWEGVCLKLLANDLRLVSVPVIEIAGKRGVHIQGGNRTGD